jgi:hypothetical protein
MLEVFLDALRDTAIVFPFILVIYILIELLERATSITKSKKMLQGPLAPLLGTVTGIIPQCGFSVMAAKLYDKGLIRTGTIMAVFIATSDEALIILLGSSAVSIQAAQSIMPLLIIKLAVALAAGYLINFLLGRCEKVVAISTNDEHDVHEEGDHGHEPHAFSCGREHDGKSKLRVYFIDPLLHSIKITIYLLIINLVFGYIIYFVGEDAISAVMIGGTYFQPFITAAIGLIPNCASSVIITQAYIQGGILFGSCVAGLCTNAGLGLVVLLKNTKKLKRNICIGLTLYLIAVAVGIIVNAIMAACAMI